MQRARCARKHDAHSDDPKEFGDGVTADHIIIPADWESYQKDRAVCVILDRGTGWVGAYPCKTKNADDTRSCFQHFLGSIIPKKVYTDGSHEFKNALKSLGLPHDVATPHRPQTNGIAERAVKRILEGARCLLKQSGLPEYFWPDAVRCFAFLYNVTVHQHDGKTPYLKRFGSEFDGPLLPFGSAVSYKPSDDATLATIPKFGERTTPGLFAGYHLHNGCTWSKDLYFYNIAKLQNATELHHIHHHRVKEFVVPQRVVYPVADGTISLLSELDRTPRLLHDQPVLPDIIDTGGDTVPDHDTSDAGGPIDTPEIVTEPDYWRFSGFSLVRVHRQPRSAYYRPDQDPDLPVPIHFLDVTRSTTIQTDLQVQQVDDFWNTSGPDTCHDEHGLAVPDFRFFFLIQEMATSMSTAERPEFRSLADLILFVLKIGRPSPRKNATLNVKRVSLTLKNYP